MTEATEATQQPESTPSVAPPRFTPVYDPRAFWCWAADDGRVFKAPACVVVNETDADFKAFVASLGYTPAWPRDAAGAQTDAVLDEVLQTYSLSTTGPVRSATTYALMSALTDAQRAAYPGPIKAWDQRLFSARDTPWPEDNPKVGRIAVALGTTAKAWFDAVFGETPAAAAPATATAGTGAGAQTASASASAGANAGS